MPGDLSVTALYTSQAWVWGGFPCAELLASAEAKRVFDVTNAALLLKPSAQLKYALVQRHAMIDRMLRESGRARVLELAAGLSQRGAALAGELDYTEIDLPPVIRKKRELLGRTEAGRAVLDKLQLVEGDVTAVELPPADFVIAEGLAMYLDGEARRALFARIAAHGDTVFVFDLTPGEEEPQPGLAGRVLEAAMKRFTGGRSFERDARTRTDVLAELRAAGFDHAEAFAARDVAGAWQLPHAERATPTVVFRASRATRS